MYQVSACDTSDPLEEWREIWRHLGESRGTKTSKTARKEPKEPKYDLALQGLAQWLQRCPDDTAAIMLQSAINMGLQGAEMHSPLLLAGKLPFRMQYYVPAAGPVESGSSEACQRREGE